MSSGVASVRKAQGDGLTPALIERAVLDREAVAVSQVVRLLTPIVQAGVVRALYRRRSAARGRIVRQEVEDLVQDVFEALLAHGGRRLLAWDPERGAATTFFRVVSERVAANVMDSRVQSPWTEDPSEPDALELKTGGTGGDERRLESREVLRELGRRLEAGLAERDRALFHALFVRGADDGVVREELGLSRDALYQARRRLKLRLRDLAGDLIADDDEPPEVPR